MAVQKNLSVFDSTCIIVGIIIGAGIYETAPAVAAGMGGWKGMMSVWLIGGLFALTGALCYAEIAGTYPRQGGDYVYLGRAYGGWAGYLFGWSQAAIIRPGDIALMAFIFSRYARQIYPLDRGELIYAASVIVALTVINILGVREGKWTQNVLTIIKVLGLLAIISGGMLASGAALPCQSESFSLSGFQLALILVLFTFGGWNEIGYVAAEVKRPQQNIVRALVMGTIIVTALYVLINAAFLHALGYRTMAASEAVAVEAVSAYMPNITPRAVAVLICLSTLGAINGLIFTGARISYALGSEHVPFRALGKWNLRLGTPVWALLIQAGLSLVIIVLAGSFLDTILYTAPVVWLFFLMTGLSVFVLRYKDPTTWRPYKVTGYPVTPLLFCGGSVFMLYSCISYALLKHPLGLLTLLSLILVGIIIRWLALTLCSSSKKPG